MALLFQFTPLREGRPIRIAFFSGCNVFQFTPLREGRRQLLPCSVLWFHFNSRPSARGDGLVPISALIPLISIHAPPRGATERSDYIVTAPKFQFTPLREGRLILHRQEAVRSLFQFTPLREGRRDTPFSFPSWATNFNSRPSARGDIGQNAGKRCGIYFNSRPSARGDVNQGNVLGIICISIHAPPRGATIRTGNCTEILPFQFTPLREGRLPASARLSRSTDFNSRPSARGDCAESRPK